MSPTLRADVTRYIDHFRSENGTLKEVAYPLYRKALVVTMRDAVARGRYPNIRGRNRFVSLIEEHSPWPYATSVSVSQLEMMINERGGAAACGLSDEFAKRLKG